MKENEGGSTRKIEKRYVEGQTTRLKEQELNERREMEFILEKLKARAE